MIRQVLISAVTLFFVALASFGFVLATLQTVERRAAPPVQLKPTIAPFVTRVIEYRDC